MSYLSAGQLVAVGPQFIAGTKATMSCLDAYASCAPPFVFSISGQVLFRHALHHLSSCKHRECRRLRSRVIRGMRRKLQWLTQEEVLLGCVQIQPYLYGVSSIHLSATNFSLVAVHLAHCPHDSCARLRRALLLTVRAVVHDTKKPARQSTVVDALEG
jgi:hypothetical protein